MPIPLPPPMDSPRNTLLPFITAEQNAAMSYPTNIMPGARDVPTPFGVMRVNEWGPIGGRKVIFVHGDGTPSPLWASMAHGLVQRGCRVMCYDIWGRGYSDTPTNIPFDGEHLALQILFAVTSSKLSWMTDPGFSIVGFSMGGAISVIFASIYANRVNSLVLLGPAGLIRNLSPDYHSPYLTMPWESASSGDGIRNMVAEFMEVRKDNPARMKVDRSQITPNAATHVAPVDEATWQPPELDDAGLNQWQFDYHEGLVRGVWATSAGGPLSGQQVWFKRTFDIFAGKNDVRPLLLADQKVLICLGDEDDVVKPDETREDILKLIPADKVEFHAYPGDHGFPFVRENTEAIIEKLAQHWSL